MAGKHGISTMAAMASRNTKAANKAKASMKSFRAAVTKILQDVESCGSDGAKVDAVHGAIKRVKTDASRVLTSLHEYSEEISAMEESTELYDGLLKEFKDYMDKLEAAQRKLPRSSPSSPRIQPQLDIAGEESVSGTPSQQTLQEFSPRRVEHPLESQILDERSQQIQSLRQSVYGIQDLYVQIGDIVEYQGDQLDDIENNMSHAFEDTLETNIHLRASAARRRGLCSQRYLIAVLVFCLVVIAVLWRKV